MSISHSPRPPLIALPCGAGVAYPAAPAGLVVRAVVPGQTVGVLQLGRAVAHQLAGDARGVDAEPLRNPGEAPSLGDSVLDPPAILRVRWA